MPPRAATSDAERDQQEQAARDAFDRARTGRPQEFALVVHTYHDRLYNAVYRLLHDHDDAQEVVQDTFAKGFEKMDGFRGEAGPYTWLFRIAVNGAMTRLRKGKRRKTVSLDEVSRMNAAAGSGWRTQWGGDVADDSAGSDPAAAGEAGEDAKAVVAALGRLDAEYRAILVMRDLEGFDYQQMADVLGLPLGTLKSRLFRARVALREQLQGHFAQ
jgi:RNA polymerase sigma-70 factor (ECF subfamily)